MEGLQTRTYNDRVFMEVENLIESELITYQLGMLQNNQLEGLCPLTIHKRDEYMRLSYDITDMQELTRYYKNKRITKGMYKELLLQVISILKSGETYLLPYQQYCVDPEHIFIKMETGQPCLIFLPTVEKEKEQGVNLSKLLTFLHSCNKTDDALELSCFLTDYPEILTVSKLKFLLMEKNTFSPVIPDNAYDHKHTMVEEKEDDSVKKNNKLIALLGHILIVFLLLLIKNTNPFFQWGHIIGILVIIGAVDAYLYYKFFKADDVKVTEGTEEIATTDGLLVYKEKGEYYLCFGKGEKNEEV